MKASGDDIRNDQRELQRLMRALGIEQSTMRKAVAWVADKASRLRLRLADFGEPNLARLQSLKTLSVGIMGKRLLWRTLDAAIPTRVRRTGLDQTRLESALRNSSSALRSGRLKSRERFLLQIRGAAKSSER